MNMLQTPTMCEALAKHRKRQPATRGGVGAGVRDFRFAEPASVAADEGLIGVGRWTSSRAPNPHPIWANHRDAYVGKIENDVWGHIGRGIVHLVNDLLLDRPGVDASSAVDRLRNDNVALCRDLGDGKADIMQIRDILEAWIRKITARHLRGAFKEVTRQGPASKQVPIRPRPTETVDQWSDNERRVGNSACYDDISSGIQRFDNPSRTDIHVRGDDLLVVVASAGDRASYAAERTEFRAAGH